MKGIITFISVCLVFSAVSCTKTEIRESAESMGCLSMNMDLRTVTKAVDGEDALRSSATVKIYKPDFEGLARSYRYSEMPESIYLVAAEGYRVDVEAGEAVAQDPSPASWTSKSYKGTKTFNIIAGTVTNVEVEATVHNAVTKITFDETVADNFNAGYTFTIGLDMDDASTQLVYDADKSGAEGYFIVAGLDEPSFKWTFSGILAKDGSSFVKSGEIEGLMPGNLYKMSLKYTIKDGDLQLTLLVDKATEIVDDTIIFEPVSTGLASSSVYEIWAAHATVHADVDPTEYDGSAIRFAYSSNGSSWTEVEGVNDSEGTWKADLKGLTPATEYTYRLLIDGVQIGDEKTFTTESAPQIPNGEFNYFSKVSGKEYYKFYDPDCGVEEGATMFWGSGNGEGKEGTSGSGDKGIYITTIDSPGSDGEGYCVLAQTSQMIGILAAGNLFTGQFAGLVGTEGGKVNFGRPWTTSRPTALKISCKYSTGVMDIVKGAPAGVNLVKNETYDCAEIKFAIGNWNYNKYGGTKDSPVHVNTTKPENFFDYDDDPSTIAYGNLLIHHDGYTYKDEAKKSATTSGWVTYEIPLDYKNYNAYPTHIIISCAASRYGDYFSGCSSSKLWIDAVELIYE